MFITELVEFKMSVVLNTIQNMMTLKNKYIKAELEEDKTQCFSLCQEGITQEQRTWMGGKHSTE